MQTRVTGLILAGGQGRRVDHRDKGLIEWRGKRLIAHVCERFRPQVDELIISCNRNHTHYRNYTDRVVSDTQDNFRGPLAGIEAAIPMVQSPLLAIVTCDMPLLHKHLVKRLAAPLNQPTSHPVDISYAHDGEQPQYLCALMRRDCLDNVADYLETGGRSVHGWYRRQRTIAVDFSDSTKAFSNLNMLD